MQIDIDDNTLEYIKKNGGNVTVQGPRPAVG